MTTKPPPTYPPTLYTRALARTNAANVGRTVRITRGTHAGCTGDIAAVAMLEDGALAFVVRVVVDGCVCRVAVDEDGVLWLA